MKASLKEKVVVVTGSSRGIGRAVAEACARAGANVVISSRDGKSVSPAYWEQYTKEIADDYWNFKK